jgi:hypothetical protein
VALEESGEVAELAELCYDVDASSFSVDDPVVVADDVGVAELAQDVHLRHEHGLLTLGHGPVVHFFPHEDLSVENGRCSISPSRPTSS